MYVTVIATTTDLALLPKGHQEPVPLPEYRLRYQGLPVTAVKCGPGAHGWAHIMDILTPENVLEMVREKPSTTIWVSDNGA